MTDVFEGQPKNDPFAYLRDMGSGAKFVVRLKALYQQVISA